jgi:hypothetical protein
MKKLGVFILISALLTFTAAMALAHDDDKNWERFTWGHFHGKYEMIGSGICNHSPEGWYDANNELNGPNPPFTPVDPNATWAANSTLRGTFQFKRNGTGTFTAINYISLLPGGNPVETISQYQVSQGPVVGSFTYKITNNGEIKIITGLGVVMTGMITTDQNIMTLVNANQILDLTTTPYMSYAIQNIARVLIRVGD